MSLSEYLNRKKTSFTAAGKRESFPGTSSDVSSPSQSLVTENTSSTDPVSSMLVNYRAASSSGTGSTFTTLCSSVSSSTGGALIEPVSPDDGYSAEDDRPVLHTIRQGMPLHRQRKRTGCTCIGYVIKILIKPLIMHL